MKGGSGHCGLLRPPELCAVGPDASQDHSYLARDGNLGLFRTDAPRQAWVPQALSGDQRWTFVNNTPAASKRQVRVKRDRQTSIFSLAGPFLRTDIDAASIRDTDLRRARLNRSGSSMVERNAKAVMGPTLGTVVKRCKVGSARTKQRISLSRAATLATATCRTSISLSISADNTG